MKEASGETQKDIKARMRKEYERSNPVLSIRLTENEMIKLKSVADKTGRKISEIVKAGMGLGAATTDQAYKKGLKKGFDKGFQKAREKYAVYATCMTCYDGIPITDDEMRDEAGLLYSNEYTCLHESCGLPKERTGVEVRWFRKEE